MRRRDVAIGLVGLAVGVVVGLLVPRDPSPARALRPGIRPSEPGIPSLAESPVPGAQPPEPDGLAVVHAASPAAMPRGTSPVKVEADEDLPFAKFAAAVLPTLDQVRGIVELSDREYAALQVSAHIEALRAILGDAFDVPREREAEAFVEEWARRKHGSHRDYVIAVDRARSAFTAGPALDEELRRLARDWALAHANLKLEKRAWLARAFAAEFPSHEDAMRRLGRHSEIAATLRTGK